MVTHTSISPILSTVTLCYIPLSRCILMLSKCFFSSTLTPCSIQFSSCLSFAFLPVLGWLLGFLAVRGGSQCVSPEVKRSRVSSPDEHIIIQLWLPRRITYLPCCPRRPKSWAPSGTGLGSRGSHLFGGKKEVKKASDSAFGTRTIRGVKPRENGKVNRIM